MDDLTPTDVYCTDHDRLIPFATSAPSRLRIFVVNALRVLACAGFLFTALANNAVPVYAVYVAVAAAVAALPLHRYQLSWRAAVCSWVAVSIGALAVAHVGRAADQVLRSLALAVILGLFAAYLATFAWFEADDPLAHRTRRAASIVLTSMALGPVALLAWAAWHWPSALLGQAPAWVSNVLLLAAVGAVTGGVLTALVVGAIDGQSRVCDQVRTLVRLPGPAKVVRWTVEARPAAGRGLGERIFSDFGHRSLIIMTAAAQATVNLLLRAANLLSIATVRLVNWLYRRIVMLWRRTWAGLTAALLLLWIAGIQGRKASGEAIRSVLVPAAALVTGGWLVWLAAEHTRGYLVTGSPTALATLAGALLVTTAVLSMVWIALCGLPWSKAKTSAGRAASVAAPQGLLLLVAGGWALGLPGTLGHGPIHVGWVTGGATALLVTAVALSRWRREKPQPVPEVVRPLVAD